MDGCYKELSTYFHPLLLVLTYINFIDNNHYIVLQTIHHGDKLILQSMYYKNKIYHGNKLLKNWEKIKILNTLWTLKIIMTSTIVRHL